MFIKRVLDELIVNLFHILNGKAIAEEFLMLKKLLVSVFESWQN